MAEYLNHGSQTMLMKRTNKSRSRSRKNPIRQRIVDAARAHFFSHGFRSVTMDDLAEELGISKKTLYAHFPGKIDLLEAVLADKFEGVETMLKEVTRAQPQDFPATLRELLAGTQRELDEIKPPFVRDMRQKAPQRLSSYRAPPGCIVPAILRKLSPRRATGGNGAKRRSGEAYHRDSPGDRSGDHESGEDGRTRNDAEGRFRRHPENCSPRCAYTKRKKT